nr:GNAT family N-acetyltransferase [uncultured Albidiferax sp.]
MGLNELIKPTPWDAVVFGVPTWEVCEYSEKALQYASEISGHYTLKVDPLADKRLLQDYGFYYCDTLVEPHCNATRLRLVEHADATIDKDIDIERALAACHGAFLHGRFLRDFNLSRAAANLRYDNWLRQLFSAKKVYGLYWRDECAGFIACSENNLVLHAVSKDYQGKGMAKYWWSAVCKEVLAAGHHEIMSSISMTNLAVLNLYASLGFSFIKPVDVYHRMVS